MITGFYEFTIASVTRLLAEHSALANNAYVGTVFQSQGWVSDVAKAISAKIKLDLRIEGATISKAGSGAVLSARIEGTENWVVVVMLICDAPYPSRAQVAAAIATHDFERLAHWRNFHASTDEERELARMIQEHGAQQ